MKTVAKFVIRTGFPPTVSHENVGKSYHKFKFLDVFLFEEVLLSHI